MRGKGGGRVGESSGQNNLRKCTRGIIQVHNLLQQAKAQSQILVQILVLKGNGKARSADNEGVKNHDRDCNPAVESTTYV